MSRYLVVLLAIAWAGAASAAPHHAEVRVQHAESLVLDRPALFQRDDVLLAYRASGGSSDAMLPLDSALHWRLLASSELLRAPILLRIRRGTQSLDLEIADGVEVVQVASTPGTDTLQSLDDRLLALIERKDWAAFDALYPQASAAAAKDPRPGAAALIALHGARADWIANGHARCRTRIAAGIDAVRGTLFEVALNEQDVLCSGFLGTWQASQKILVATVALLDRLAPRSLAHARVSATLAQIDSFTAPKPALARVEQAVATAQARCGECRDYGLIRVWQGDVLSASGRYAEARDAYTQSVRIARALEPQGYGLPERLRLLARAHRLLGDMEAALPLLEESLRLMRASKVPEADYAPVYNSLGVVHAERGDFLGASAWFRRAFDVLVKAQPKAGTTANAQFNLGWTLAQAGDFAGAEREMRAATAITETYDSGLGLAVFLNGLADVEIARGNDEAALPILVRAQALRQANEPDGVLLGDTYLKLAKLHARQQRRASAQAAWRAAMDIFAKMPADSPLLSEPLIDSGLFELAQGHPAAAGRLFQRALDLYRRQSPDSLQMSRALQGAGAAALARAAPREAAPLLEQALNIRRRDVPGSALVAETLHALGQVAEADDDAAQAQTRYCAATGLLDTASLRAGGDEFGEARFRAQFAEFYRDCIRAQAEGGDAAAALQTLERARARGFRNALEQRRLQLADPQQRKALDALARNAGALTQASSHANDPALDAAQRERARAERDRLQAERQPLQERLYRVIPAFAAQNIAQLRQRLRADEAYLAYSVGDRETYAFVLRARGPVLAQRIRIDRATLESRVAALRRQLQNPQRLDRWRRDSAALAADLIDPLEAALGDAGLLLISPDGPLHDLPFAALWNERRGRFLIESRALSFVDALGARRLPTDPAAVAPAERVLAVGDPAALPSADGEFALRLRRAGAGSAGLPALPAARREIEALAERYPARVHVLLGARATEYNVRREASAAGELHFAVHALLDRERPLESALVLHPGAMARSQDDGLLQVYEVLEDLRLDADLVVLSACDTALGQQLAGEGVLGFARAFAFAGARTTIASLWSVQDQSTAGLMARFYDARSAHAEAAVALREAMLAMIRARPSADAGTRRGVGGLSPHDAAPPAPPAHPYYWAAFQVYGG